MTDDVVPSVNTATLSIFPCTPIKEDIKYLLHIRTPEQNEKSLNIQKSDILRQTLDYCP